MTPGDNALQNSQGVVEQLQQTIELLHEQISDGDDSRRLIQHARALASTLADFPGAAAVVAGYQLKGSPRVFYPADWRPTDIHNFNTLVYAHSGETLSVPNTQAVDVHYVLRHAIDGGCLGETYSLVRAGEWSAILRGAEGECVKDAKGHILSVLPMPVASRAGEGDTMCSHEQDAPCYVLQYKTHVGGRFGEQFGLVSVPDWENGMSGAVARQVSDAHGRPLMVFSAPHSGAVEKAAPCN